MASSEHFKDKDGWEFDHESDTDYSDAEMDPESEDDCEVTSANNLNKERDMVVEDSDDESEKLYFSKDESIVWSSNFPCHGRRPVANILTEKPGAKGLAKKATTVIDCWNLFFPSELITKLVLYTNEKLSTIRPNYGRQADCLDTDECEMKAFLGLLYYSGLLNLSHVDIHDLWKSNGLSPVYFRAVMRENRLRLLLRALRFDNQSTRAERKKSDKLAPIREFWDYFNECSLKFYSPGSNVTIDEMIAAFRGRCSFKQYIPSKPDRYGLKIFGMVDSESFYTCNMELYVGKQPSQGQELSNKPYDIVKRVCHSILDTGRNITMDNWFSSVPLTINLLENHKTTVVATLKRNKTQIPSEFVSLKNREPCSSLFGFYRNMTMVSYVSKSKKKKCTVLISSMHKSNTIDQNTGDKKKPEIITYYNQTKAAVDVVDQMRAKYNVARTSRRWPLTTFFVLMNVAVINAMVIYNCNSVTSIKRKELIEILHLELTKPLLIKRESNPRIRFDLRQAIRNCLQLSVQLPVQEKSKDTIKRCAYCPPRKNRKTQSCCTVCLRLICGEHTIKMCSACFEAEKAFVEE